MRHYKPNTISDRELYEKLDYYDYSEFDDDYYFDLVKERDKNKSKRSRPARNRTRYNSAVEDYIEDY
ncbi:MAG: hypothetical protein KDF58_13925 [Alphaproteobacteria bacterium]|nr:hypothetical protein [Alphaproteobacteria bacterium]HRW29165.1 hypothetical protein [Emcibacteraceae bacterium]